MDDAAQEETIRLNADIPLSLHIQLRRYLLEQPKGTTQKHIIIAALNEYIQRNI